MNRREFGISLVGGALAAGLPGSRGRLGAQTAPLQINGARLNAHLAELSKFGANPQGGVSRVAYSAFDKAGRSQVIEWMRDAHLTPSIDSAGNIFGRRLGFDAARKPLIFGSHIDSVPEGGNYDGDLGTLAAIEVAQTLAEKAVPLRHRIEVVVWSNEEGGLTGSSAVSGQLPMSQLKQTTWSGKTVGDGIAFLGGDSTKLESVKRQRGDIAGYFELHIEQGGVLEAEKLDVGIVEGIVGIRQWEVTVTGFANHAGTTPMDRRQDALLATAQFIEMVNRVVRSIPGRQVGTVGKIQAYPGAANVIPGKVVCTLELRDLDDAKINVMYDKVRTEAKQIGDVNKITFDYVDLHTNISAPSDPRMRDIIAKSARGLGLSSKVMPSGAGHDAQSMAQLGPMGMIFIPSIGGISHSPKEYSRPQDCVNGANVLLAAVLEADKTLD